MSKIPPLDVNSALTALSPLDGRYQPKLISLRPICSEFGLIYFRVLIECKWLTTLANHPKIDIDSLPTASKARIERLVSDFTLKEAEKIKALEDKTKHDVKAVEYYLKAVFSHDIVLARYIPLLHFGLTSDDVNNLAYALMMKTAFVEVMQPWMKKITLVLKRWAKKYANLPMPSLTHGQIASPTTFGKECANWVSRLQRQFDILKKATLMGKLNGAVGNFNAQKIAYPKINWIGVAKKFVQSLGLTYNPYTTQIEPHDSLVEWLQIMIRFNSIALDLVKDIWGYINLGYIIQKKQPDTIGSSTMPHKINPIHFENAEGNLGVANALAQHFVTKLPISRFQRDLSDSTVLRNMGCIFGYSTLAYQSIIEGLEYLTPNAPFLSDVLNTHWEILTEAVQTVLRRYGVKDAYEQVSALSHGRKLTQKQLHAFIDTLEVDHSVREELKQLTPQDYLGESVKLAQQIDQLVQ